jgi:mannonate dehydratase
MKETWRWFGPQDPVSLDNAKQAGATGIVTALHHLYHGEKWPAHEIEKRKAEIQAVGLVWSVVESIPIHESIKLGNGVREKYIAAWKDSMVAVARAGVKIICYNFMPIVDWTRTDLKWALPSTAFALRFDAIDLAAYDLFLLRRKHAEDDYSPDIVASAQARFEVMPEGLRTRLEQTIIGGLPASQETYDREAFRRMLGQYEGVTARDLRANLIAFLGEVVPVAQENGLCLAIHPDDPPRPLFGVPRVVSTAEDARAILNGIENFSNGLTFCTGSYGARADNDLLAMVRDFAPRIHFAHLRQVAREPDGSFYEAEHLSNSTEMVAIVRELLLEEARRRRQGEEYHEIPMRPDHGHMLADDINRKGNAGYSLIGRLKGLAELRGVMRALEWSVPELQHGAAPSVAKEKDRV